MSASRRLWRKPPSGRNLAARRKSGGYSQRPNRDGLAVAGSSQRPNRDGLAVGGYSQRPNRYGLAVAGSSQRPNRDGLAVAGSSQRPNRDGLTVGGGLNFRSIPFVNNTGRPVFVTWYYTLLPNQLERKRLELQRQYETTRRAEPLVYSLRTGDSVLVMEKQRVELPFPPSLSSDIQNDLVVIGAHRNLANEWEPDYVFGRNANVKLVGKILQPWPTLLNSVPSNLAVYRLENAKRRWGELVLTEADWGLRQTRVGKQGGSARRAQVSRRRRGHKTPRTNKSKKSRGNKFVDMPMIAISLDWKLSGNPIAMVEDRIVEQARMRGGEGDGHQWGGTGPEDPHMVFVFVPKKHVVSFVHTIRDWLPVTAIEVLDDEGQRRVAGLGQGTVDELLRQMVTWLKLFWAKYHKQSSAYLSVKDIAVADLMRKFQGVASDRYQIKKDDFPALAYSAYSIVTDAARLSIATGAAPMVNTATAPAPSSSSAAPRSQAIKDNLNGLGFI